jgi:8-oxo-dGTP pyrophosphatase MutT (NUDIX family)
VVDPKDGPSWLQSVLARVQHDPPQDRRLLAHRGSRRAAVLVLIIDGRGGPSLLLTQRAQHLANYPSQLAFPGGAVEPGDDGPATTALREAREEIGISPDSIHVIGFLGPLALLDTSFLVTAVVGWCPRMEFSGAVNSDEVTATVQVPLHDFARKSTRVRRDGGAGAPISVMTVDGMTVGTMTAAVIQLLFDHPRQP